ncbi:hypothetical protein [Nafulsella turpanensis]|uniref:hypothetical protein n=1 Tax=Nafulsella turpanensis TaxID=1265690 RepID=UPI00034B133A|nr:hypothetical protein [Nafulsella turpanensis]
MKLFLLFLLLYTSTTLKAQPTEREIPGRPLHGIKAGIIGLWYSYEKKIDRQTTFNLEAGWYLTFGGGYYNNSNGIPIFFLAPIFEPAIRLEPRWYYNLLKRYEKGKNIQNYSANYLALTTKFDLQPFFSTTPPALRIIPKWGNRRRLGNHFIFETAIGVGAYIDQDVAFGLPGLDLKFGYIF